MRYPASVSFVYGEERPTHTFRLDDLSDQILQVGSVMAHTNSSGISWASSFQQLEIVQKTSSPSNSTKMYCQCSYCHGMSACERWHSGQLKQNYDYILQGIPDEIILEVRLQQLIEPGSEMSYAEFLQICKNFLV